MTWSYGNMMWQFPFKSLNGTSCRIDVYKRGYTGEFVYTGMKVASDPVYFEEDDDEDLLNNVLRYRTGYIRIIEEYSHGFLSDIYPTDSFDRYVEIYYGNDLVFNGYIQRQDFSDEMVPVPRVLELPIISPLGLYEIRKFQNTAYQPPTSKTLGELLDVALTNYYDYVYLPKKYGYPNQVSLGMKISTLVVTPWNDNYHHSMNVAAYNLVMTGESYAFLIEAICKAFGWIAHDTPGALIFTAFDYEDEYCYFPVGHIGESGYQQDANISAAAINLEDYFTLADDQANMTTLLPETGIEIDYEGETGSRTFTFDHTFVPDNNPVAILPSFIPDMSNYPNHAEIFSLCNLRPISSLYEFSSSLGTLSFNNDDKIPTSQGICAWNGKEGVMISLGSYSAGHEWFWIRFYMRKYPGQSFGFSFDMVGRRDGSIGGLYYNPDIEANYVYRVIDTSHEDYIQVTFKYGTGGLPNNALIFIYNMKLDVFEDSEPYAEYRYMPATDSDIIPDTGNPAISNSVDMPISLYRKNDHLIGTSLRSTKLTTYPYLFSPRKMLVSKFRYAAALTFPHIKLFNYMNKKWRIIAQRFDPWNDEYQLTMQNSSVL